MPRLCRGICQPAERVWKMEPKRIVLDVDTGTDDAIALMTALLAPQLKVEAICTVHGNTTVENTTANTLKAAYAVGRTDVPVYPGAAGPMVKRLIPSRAIPVPEPILSGTAQIDGVTVAMNPDELPLPVSPQQAEDQPAAVWYLSRLRSAQKKATIVATGALTNLGLALAIDPGIADGIEEIVIMGGGVKKSNITASAEANFFKDPEAAAIVLGCGAPITLCTLDATHSCALTREHELKIRKIGTPAAVFTANDIHARRESYARLQPLERAGTAPIHDALCVAYLLDPSVLTQVEDACCTVDCSAGISEGRLQVDTRYFKGKCNLKLATQADPDRMCDILVSVFEKAKSAKERGKVQSAV